MAEATTLEIGKEDLGQADRERVYRRNFGFFLADGILFTVAMTIIGPTTIIPDFVRRLTGSEILIGLSGSMFDILWTLPAPLGAFGSTGDPRALVLLGLNFGIAFLIYAPFVRTYDRRMLAMESRLGAAASASPPPAGTRVEAAPPGALNHAPAADPAPIRR
jgi:hypothetical protein